MKKHYSLYICPDEAVQIGKHGSGDDMCAALQIYEAALKWSGAPEFAVGIVFAAGCVAGSRAERANQHNAEAKDNTVYTN